MTQQSTVRMGGTLRPLLLSPVALLGEDNDSIEDGEEEDYGDDDDQGYLVGLSEEDMASHTIELIAGIRPGAVWLIVDGNYIQVVNSQSVDCNTYWWECRFRRHSQCRAAITTRIAEDEDDEAEELNKKHEIVWMVDPQTHICGQDKVDVVVTKFKADVLQKMKNDFKAKYMQVYETKKKEVLKAIKDVDFKERVRYSLPTAASLKSASRAQQRGVPVLEQGHCYPSVSTMPPSPCCRKAAYWQS